MADKEFSGKIIEGIEYGLDITGEGKVIGDVSVDLLAIATGIAAKSSKPWVQKVATFVTTIRAKLAAKANAGSAPADDASLKPANDFDGISAEADEPKNEKVDDEAAAAKPQMQHVPL